jgi:aminoglycoside phosphotransferase (APT) family kinase protein
MPIPDQGALSVAPGVHRARLESWLESTLGADALPFSLTPVQGGASNLTYRIERSGRSYCLRRPPLVSNDPSSNSMRRELQLLRALSRTTVPHPRLVAACEDETILGAPFALMEWIDGFTAKDPLPEPFASDVNVRHGMAHELIDTLARIGNLDWRSIGLEGFGKPEGFLERQVDRWLGQLTRSQARELPHFKALADWLRAHTPKMQRAALMHGDYQFVNVMFARSLPVQLAAVVDWESATIGDPLLDLGWVLALWPQEGEDSQFPPYLGWMHFPPRSELAARYHAGTGLDTSALPFYMVLALFKLAVIMEGWYTKFRHGQTSHPAHAAAEHDVPEMLARAARFARL